MPVFAYRGLTTGGRSSHGLVDADSIRAAWQQHDERPKSYTAGSWGPAAASSLIGRDGFAWRNEL